MNRLKKKHKRNIALRLVIDDLKWGVWTDDMQGVLLNHRERQPRVGNGKPVNYQQTCSRHVRTKPQGRLEPPTWVEAPRLETKTALFKPKASTYCEMMTAPLAPLHAASAQVMTVIQNIQEVRDCIK
jgi:hypothetical protein